MDADHDVDDRLDIRRLLLSPRQPDSHHPRGDANYTTAAFDAASKYLYFLTDDAREFTALKRHSLADGKVESVQSAPWDIVAMSFSHNGKYTLESIPSWWEGQRKALYTEMGDPVKDRAMLEAASPLLHADRIRRPLIVLQGANDPRVLKLESDEVVAAVKKNGVTAEYIVFPDEGHGFTKKANQITGYNAVLRFVDQYLKAGSPASR